jgi:hypothetical protein
MVFSVCRFGRVLAWVGAVTSGGSAGCSDVPFEGTEESLEGIESELRTMDSVLLQLEDTAIFRQTQRYFEARPELPAPAYDGRTWTFDANEYRATFSFVGPGGRPQTEPDEGTIFMNVTVDETASTSLGVPADMYAELRATTTDPLGFGSTIFASHRQGHDITAGADGIAVRRGLVLVGDAAVDLEDRGAGAMPRYCPRGTVRGMSTAWGSSDVDASIDPLKRGPDEDFGRTTLSFEARFSGGELIWMAFDETGTPIADGRERSAFAQGC